MKNTVFQVSDAVARRLTFEKAVTAAPALIAEFDPFPGTLRTHSFGVLRNELTLLNEVQLAHKVGPAFSTRTFGSIPRKTSQQLS